MKSRIILSIVSIWLASFSRVLAIAQWPITVTNIAELKSLSVSWVQSAEYASTVPTSPAVYVLGYYIPGDRGGGMFEWDPNSSAAPDGGYYIATNGWSSGNGRWVRRLAGDVPNIRMWGAKGDATTDDAPATQHAIDFLTNGGTLYIPAGTYKLNATVNSGNLFNQNYALHLATPNVTIRGDGPSSVLFQSDCRTTLLYGDFYTSAIAGLTIENIKFQGDTNNAYYADLGPYASGKMLVCAGGGPANGWTKYLRIRNVTTDDQGKRNAFHIFGLDDVIIEKCRFIHFATTNGNMGPGFPSVWTSGEGLGSFQLINNYFDGGTTSTNPSYGAHGIVWEQNGEETVISGNIINNFQLEGIQCGAEKQTISGNIFRASWVGAIPLSITSARTNVQLTIANNIQTGGGTFVVNTDVSWATNSTIDATIANNTCMFGNKASGQDGRIGGYLVNLRRAVVTGNTFDNYADQGLILSGNGKNDSTLLVQGNSLTSLGTNYPGSGVGVHIGSFRNISVLNNIISSEGDGPIVVGTFSGPTNAPGRVVFGNNIYVAKDNATPSKWVRVGGVTITTATTNAGNYLVSDLNPGAF